MRAGLWIILGRELYEQARRPWTYWLRVVLALIAVGVFALTALWSAMGGAGDEVLGRMLFHNLQGALSIVSWVVVPFLVCDTLSREKREGTLGLLFLTPLRPGSVVVGKSLAHGFRALSYLAAFVPVLAVPWLVGGVGWREYLVAFSLDVTAVALAVSAGLLASAVCKQWSWTMVLAPLFALTLFSLFVVAHEKGMSSSLARPVPFQSDWRSYLLGNPMPHSWVITRFGGAGAVWRQVTTQNAPQGCLALSAWCAAVSVLLAALVARAVAYGLQISLRAGGPSRWRTAWQDVWTRPRVAKTRLRRKMQRALDRNPVGWLQQHRASARATKWTWCLAVVVLQVFGLLRVDWNALPWLQFWLCLFLALGLAFSAAGSFRGERESGAFELLLVTPLRERDIVWGRLRGLWAQFAPGFIAVLGAALWWSIRGGRFPTYHWGWSRALPEPFYHVLPWVAAVGWLSVPAIGLRASLVRRTFARAWLATVAWGFLLPSLIALAVVLPMFGSSVWLRNPGTPVVGFLGVLVAAQSLIAWCQLTLLQRRMSRREFHILPT